MRILVNFAVAALAVSMPGLAQAQEQIIRSFMLEDISEFMGMMNGSMAAVQAGERPGDIEATLTYENGETADFMAMNCEPGDAVMRRACTHFLITKDFEMKSAQIARALSARFDAAWYADTTFENIFVLRRMDWISNGVTPGHLGSALFEFSIGIDMTREMVVEANGG